MTTANEQAIESEQPSSKAKIAYNSATIFLACTIVFMVPISIEAINSSPTLAQAFLSSGENLFGILLSLTFIPVALITVTQLAYERRAINGFYAVFFAMAMSVTGLGMANNSPDIITYPFIAKKLPPQHPVIDEIPRLVKAGNLDAARTLIVDHYYTASTESQLRLKMVAAMLPSDDPVAQAIDAELSTGYLGKGVYQKLLQRVVQESDLRQSDPQLLAQLLSN